MLAFDTRAAVYLLGWILIHFIWQGALIGGVYALLRKTLQSDLHRYTAGLCSLFSMALCPALTGWQLWPGIHTTAALVPMPPDAFFVDTELSKTVSVGAATDFFNWETLLPWCVTAWMCGVFLLSANSLRHWRLTNKLISSHVAEIPLWTTSLQTLCQRFAICRSVRLLSSTSISTPTLIGTFKPVILLPLSVLTGFTVRQIELIIAHELAHIRRWDYAANLFQVVLETVLFYHPLVHWISRDVRDLRENCCDDLVIELAGGDRIEYAHTLVDLEELRGSFAPPALAASGGVLLARVHRIVGQRIFLPHVSTKNQSFLIAGLLASLAFASVKLMSLSTVTRSVSAAVISVARWRPPLLPFHAMDILSDGALLDATPVSAVMPSSVQNSSDTGHQDVSSSADASFFAERPRHVRRAWILPPRSMPHIADIPQTLSAIAPPDKGVANPAGLPPALRMIQPSYPTDAFRRGVEGYVDLSFKLTADGEVADVQIMDSLPPKVFDEAALSAVKQWHFRPDISATGASYRRRIAFSLQPNTAESIESQTVVGQPARTSAGTRAIRTSQASHKLKAL